MSMRMRMGMRTVKLNTSLHSWPYLQCRALGFTSLGLTRDPASEDFEK